MRDRGDKITEVPPAMKVDGKSYMLDDTMKAVFKDEFERVDPDRLRDPSAALAHLRWRDKRVLGDPVAASRQRAEARSQFWETVRFVNETL